MATIYLFPTELEAQPFQRLCPDAEAVVSGVGMAATAATIARLYCERGLSSADVVLLSGIAGAYDDSVAVGQVVEVMSEDCVELPARFRVRYKQDAPFTTLQRVASNTVHAMRVEPTTADIENMEGATLFAMAEVMGFRAVEIRAISNRVCESFDMWHVEEALEALAKELKKVEYAE